MLCAAQQGSTCNLQYIYIYIQNRYSQQTYIYIYVVFFSYRYTSCACFGCILTDFRIASQGVPIGWTLCSLRGFLDGFFRKKNCNYQKFNKLQLIDSLKLLVQYTSITSKHDMYIYVVFTSKMQSLHVTSTYIFQPMTVNIDNEQQHHEVLHQWDVLGWP